MSLAQTCCLLGWHGGIARTFSTSSQMQQLIKLSRVRVVDNSAIGRAAELANRPGKVIQVYNTKGVAMLGDKVLLAIQGQKKRAYVVGLKQKQKTMVPRTDTNNVVLVEDSGTPTGTRIRVPIPTALRGCHQGTKHRGEFTKILALATKFV